MYVIKICIVSLVLLGFYLYIFLIVMITVNYEVIIFLKFFEIQT